MPYLDLRLTADGSHTLFSQKFGAAYHSSHGAVQESRHVFIRHGLSFSEEGNSRLAVLEAGFGTGLNAWLAAVEAERRRLFIDYLTFETEPVEESVWRQLNYPAAAQLPDYQPLFEKIHKATWDGPAQVSPHFRLEKRHAPIESLAERSRFDVVFFDAFSPDVQPELWGEAVLEKVFLSMKTGGVLTTFCSQGAFRRALRTVGFSVEKLPGAPGKWEMVRATRPFRTVA